MAQITVRTTEELVARVRACAKASDRSMNEFVTVVLDAATNPDAASSEDERIRERLERAGLAVARSPKAGRRPPRAAVEAARRAAGQGTPLADLVSRDR